MATLYESLFGFGALGIISIIVILFLLILFLYKNSKNLTTVLSLPFIFIIDFVNNFFKNNTPMIGADNCSIIPGTTSTVNRVPSSYLAHIVFFFSFLFTNAYYVHVTPKEDGSSNEQYENRRNRTAMIMSILVLLYITIVVIRSKVTGCESHFGVLFTTISFGSLGFGFYKLAEFCGMRSSDVLGITTSFISKSAEKPVACART